MKEQKIVESAEHTRMGHQKPSNTTVKVQEEEKTASNETIGGTEMNGFGFSCGGQIRSADAGMRYEFPISINFRIIFVAPALLIEDRTITQQQ